MAVCNNFLHAWLKSRQTDDPCNRVRPSAHGPVIPVAPLQLAGEQYYLLYLS